MSSRVFIGNLPSDLEKRDIEEFFSDYTLKNIDLLFQKSFGFVDFETEVDASDAISKMNGAPMKGRDIAVQPATTRAQGSGPRGGGGKGRFIRNDDLRVEVSNVSSRTNWRSLKDWGKTAGDVQYATVFDRNGESRGILEFVDKAGFDCALDTLNGTECDGRKLEVMVLSEMERSRPNMSPRRHRSPMRRRSRSPPGYGRRRSPVYERHRSRSPVRKYRSRSPPVYERRRSRSPVVARRRSRSPPVYERRRSRSPVVARRRSRSPVVARHRSRSPAYARDYPVERRRYPSPLHRRVSPSPRKRYYSPSPRRSPSPPRGKR